MMGPVLEFITKSLPILAAIFTTILCSILLLRLVLTFLINRSYHRYLALKNASKNTLSNITPWKKKYVKEEEELKRKKELPKANSQIKAENRAKAGQGQSGSYELMPSNQKQLDQEEMSKVEIVDIVKPIGFWTSVILGQKLTYLIQSAQMLNKRGNKGFWVSMIEAKDRAAGRQHGRGR